MKRTTLLKFAVLPAFVVATVGSLNTTGQLGANVRSPGYSVLSNGRGGTNVEGVVYTPQMHFDKQRLLEAFKKTVYPLLREHCSGCHSTANTFGSGAQAPLTADPDVNLAHEYALTRVDFRTPADSKLVVRMTIDRHNCFGSSCAEAGKEMLAAVTAWRDAIADMIPPVPRGVPESEKISEQQILSWIDADKAKTPAEDRDFIKYVSFAALHNAGVTAEDMNNARAGLSKTLNGSSRWAPRIVNPVDANGKGILYKFDTRDYSGYTLIDTSDPNFALFYGGSDDDLAFAKSKVDLNDRPIKYGSLLGMVHKLKPEVTRDDKFARLVWARVLKGNAEAADQELKTFPPNIDGFVGKRDIGPTGSDYVAPDNLKYVEAAQLTDGGFYWKTFDIFTQGDANLKQAYQKGDVTYPFWSHPIPKFISNQGGTTPADLRYVATLPLGGYPFNPHGSVGHYTGQDGPQQSAEEVIWSPPNGLQGYALFGAWNQRRVDAFTNIVRDPRIQRYVADDTNANLSGFGTDAAVSDHRLNNASSCIGCHIDGMNRANENMRDWLDEGDRQFPKGEYGADAWLKDPETVKKVRELYPPSSVMRTKMENDRRVFPNAMAQIKQGMVLGVDKNLYVEPTIWTIEWAQHYYKYATTRSN